MWYSTLSPTIKHMWGHSERSQGNVSWEQGRTWAGNVTTSPLAAGPSSTALQMLHPQALRLYHLVHLVTYGRKHCILLEDRTARKVQPCSCMAIAGLLQASAGVKKSHGEWLMWPVVEASVLWQKSLLRVHVWITVVWDFLSPSPHPPMQEKRDVLTLCWYPVSHPHYAIDLVTS